MSHPFRVRDEVPWSGAGSVCKALDMKQATVTTKEQIRHFELSNMDESHWLGARGRYYDTPKWISGAYTSMCILILL